MGVNYYEYIQSNEWRQRANAAKQRAGYCCQICNRSSVEVTLNAHHRTYERLGHEHPDDITVLCRDCHELYEVNKKLPRPPVQHYQQYSPPPMYTKPVSPVLAQPVVNNKVKQDNLGKEFNAQAKSSPGSKISGKVIAGIIGAVCWGTFLALALVNALSPNATPLSTVQVIQSPTPVQVATPKPSPTIKLVQATPPKGWKKYTSKQTRFSAYLPPKFVPEEHLIKDGDPARAVSFAPDSQHIGPDYIVVSVIYTPYVDVAGHEPTELELIEYISKWIVQSKVKIIIPPVKVNIGDYLAFELVHQATLTDKNYVLQAHAAFISTPDGLYYVEVAGFLDYDYGVNEYYKTFMEWFRPVNSQ